MTWQQLIDKMGKTRDAALFAFGHHHLMTECPSRAWLFRSICQTVWKNFQWHPWAVIGSEALAKHQILGIHGGGNASKTDLASLWAIVSWWSNPTKTLVLVTSTSLKDSKKRMWGRIKHYLTEAGDSIPGQMLDAMVRTVVDGKQYEENCGIHLIAGEKKKEQEAVGKMIGLKNETIIVVADELPELSGALFFAYLGNLALNARTQFVGIGNFASIYDPLGELCRPKNGWGSITVDDEEWETERGWCIRFDCLKSPNFNYEKDKWKFLYGRKDLKHHKEKLGENSIQFWRMCRSFPCPIGAEDTIYSEADFLTGRACESCEFDDPRSVVKVAAHDPAFTHDGDKAPLIIGSFGISNKLPTLRVDKLILLREDVTNPAPRDIQIVQKLKEACLREGVAPGYLAVDGSGAGMAFASIVHQVWHRSVVIVQFGGHASNRPVYTHDPRPAKELYGNRVTELWFCGVEYMRGSQLRGIPAECARQMKSRKYKTVKGVDMRTVVEPKLELKKRLLYSPDEADCYFILLELCRQKFGFLAETGKMGFSNLRKTFKEIAMAKDEVYHNMYAEP